MIDLSVHETLQCQCEDCLPVLRQGWWERFVKAFQQGLCSLGGAFARVLVCPTLPFINGCLGASWLGSLRLLGGVFTRVLVCPTLSFIDGRLGVSWLGSL